MSLIQVYAFVIVVAMAKVLWMQAILIILPNTLKSLMINRISKISFLMAVLKKSTIVLFMMLVIGKTIKLRKIWLI